MTDDDKVRCIQCGCFVSYEEAYVESVEPDEDGYETIENCICKWCKEENK